MKNYSDTGVGGEWKIKIKWEKRFFMKITVEGELHGSSSESHRRIKKPPKHSEENRRMRGERQKEANRTSKA